MLRATLLVAVILIRLGAARSFAAPIQPRSTLPPAQASSVSNPYPAVADSELASIFAAWAKRDPKVQPEKVMAALALQPGQVVADLGAGHGYFSYRFAKAIGPLGKVLALDVSAEYLAINQRVADMFSLDNLETRVVPPDDPQLKPGEADVIFVSYTWQFLDDRIHYATLLRNALDNDGLLAVLGLEIPGVSHEKSDKTYRWTNRQEVWREAEAGGLQLSADHRSLRNQFYLFFHPGQSPLFDQIPGFTYLTSNLAIGISIPDSTGFEALRARGFRQILDLRRNLSGRSSGSVGGLKQVRVSPDEFAARDSLAASLNDMDFGITYAFSDSLTEAAMFILSACESGFYRMSPFDFDHLYDVAHPIRK